MMNLRILLCLILCTLCATSVFAAFAIDEDFEDGTEFTNLNGDEPTTIATTVKGVNVFINKTYAADPAYENFGNPIVYTENLTIGDTVDIPGGGKCFQVLPGKVFQIGSMDAEATFVNGHIPAWGDGNAIVQSALAVDTGALSAADGAVVGKLEIAFDTTSRTDAAKLKIHTYELRKDGANNQIDVYSISKNAVATKVLDGLNGTNWANISTVIFCRGLNTDPITSQWGNMALGGQPQKGPAVGTIMATANAGDSARLSVFVNGNAPANAYGWDATNADGRPDTKNHNDAGIMGIRYTAGAANSLYIDDIFVDTEELANSPAADPEPRLNEISRLNAFTAPAQGVPTGAPPAAGAKAWELY